ncbi:hypothetical protein FACS1894105_13420 [Clostridia bacterium]|nr:hypothetical protein FACS1894105_13420 [Clostridia bacterium]
MSYNIVYYENENGKSEVREFIRSLSPRLRSKTIKLVDLLELFGTELDMPYARPLGDGLFELRPNGDNKIARILYFFHFYGDIIITNGFIKKTENTPNSAIDKAKILKADYIRRHKI